MKQTQPKFSNNDGNDIAVATANPQRPDDDDDDDDEIGCGCLIGCLTIIFVVLTLLVGIKYIWQLLWA